MERSFCFDDILTYISEHAFRRQDTSCAASLSLYVSANALICGSVAFTRQRPSKWGSSLVRRTISSSRTLPAHTWAYEMKKRSAALYPSISPPFTCPSLIAFCIATDEIFTPPLSAIFSPSKFTVGKCTFDNSLFRWTSRRVSVCEPWSFRRRLYSTSLPDYPLCRSYVPWSSKPCDISCPITTPMAP